MAQSTSQNGLPVEVAQISIALQILFLDHLHLSQVLSTCRAYHRLLSKPKEVLLIDFQQTLRDLINLDLLLEPLQIISLPVTECGSCNALICWFEVRSPHQASSTDYWLDVAQ